MLDKNCDIGLYYIVVLLIATCGLAVIIFSLYGDYGYIQSTQTTETIHTNQPIHLNNLNPCDLKSIDCDKE